MRVALFSDVHANLPAFEAFLSDVDSRDPDAVYCLGDLIGYNVWPNEVIDEIRKRKIPAIAGNHDLRVKYMVTLEHHLKESGKGHAYHLVKWPNRDYLGTLPAHIRLEYKLNDDQRLNVVLAHGSTRSVDEYVLEDMDEAYLTEMMKEADADILCVGHSHKPYHRIINTKGKFKHVINLGSVGKPKDGNPDGCYVMLTLTDNSTADDKDSINVEFIRVPYDVETAARAIENSLLPKEFAERLRNAN
ncbi:metallophosphoesterase family protein [Mucilaginibacter sp. ZT4R22]|uniref:Metallophosphoesterase family protein n=1 Tax=Mucilaginibacter pankratovii TaxID=2772110 RepID=A0ABR7WT25_9SPHI|nr:metallophosphoesterase family protein [Mucilaginibacter pankratovii]MBD1364549.1 metallophosphoesterase family protein [Mucilaginibacter pankratovii]